MAVFAEESGSLADLKSWVRTTLKSDDGFVYRGQKVAWPLSTSLERACQKPDGVLSDDAPDLEKSCIREFRRRVHHYVRDVPRSSQRFELLALMQHHGAPTRLLDWTYSLEIATYFALAHAVDDPKDDVAVWIVNDTWCKETAIQMLAKTRTPEQLALISQPIEYKHEPRLARILLDDPVVPFVFPINPFRLNPRLTLQKGVFLCTGDVKKSFEENLCSLEDHHIKKNVLKFTLKHSCRQDAARRLFDLNISDASLFPGLDGFARSLKMTLRFLESRSRVSEG